jgi:acetyl-CoA carboxylase biotin carboxyl carrier protein
MGFSSYKRADLPMGPFLPPEKNQRRPMRRACGGSMNKGVEQDVAFIQALAQLLRESDLTELEVEREYGEGDELKVRLSRAVSAPPAAHMPHAGPHPGAPALPHAPSHGLPNNAQAHSALMPVPEPVDDTPDLSNAVTSPMVGTAYLSPEPGAEPFVSPGDQVAEGDTIMIIEAMKTMNQIPAPRAGRIRAVLVENAEPVEFGEPLMIID